MKLLKDLYCPIPVGSFFLFLLDAGAVSTHIRAMLLKQQPEGKPKLKNLLDAFVQPWLIKKPTINQRGVILGKGWFGGAENGRLDTSNQPFSLILTSIELKSN